MTLEDLRLGANINWKGFDILLAGGALLRSCEIVFTPFGE